MNYQLIYLHYRLLLLRQLEDKVTMIAAKDVWDYAQIHVRISVRVAVDVLVAKDAMVAVVVVVSAKTIVVHSV